MDDLYDLLHQLCDVSTNGGVQITYYSDPEHETTVDWLAPPNGRISRGTGPAIEDALEDALFTIQEAADETADA